MAYSRRWFCGLLGGALVAPAVPQPVIPSTLVVPVVAASSPTRTAAWEITNFEGGVNYFPLGNDWEDNLQHVCRVLRMFGERHANGDLVWNGPEGAWRLLLNGGQYFGRDDA